MSEATIFVVEDEASFVEALSIGLRREGFDVVVAVDGAEALARFDEVQPDLVLLDVMLPKVTGLEVCRQLRKRTQVPIIMVTAKSAEIDTVVGLEVGADDYVTKPYRIRELVARIRAVLRRAETTGPVSALSPGTIEVGEVRLDPDEHRASVERCGRFAAAQGVRTPPSAARQRGPRAAPRDAHRPRVGHRLRRRHEDPRRAREAPAVEDRARPRQSHPDRHHPRPRLQVRTGLTRITFASDSAGRPRRILTQRVS